MKGIGQTILAATIIAVLMFSVTEDVSAETPEPPSLDEIVNTITPPDYTWETFVSDAQTMFSSDMLSKDVRYFQNLADFVANETFIKDINEGTFTAESVTDNYVDIFFLVCIALAVLCVVGAVISYMINRKTFNEELSD